MTATQTQTPASVLLLADHLDAVLAAGEDMLALAVDIPAAAPTDGASAPWDYLAALVADAKLFELSIVSRVLQARNRAQDMVRDLGRDGEIFAPLLALFAGGTVVLEEAAAELAGRGASDFDVGLDPLVYLRTRGVIGQDVGSLKGITRVEIGEAFLVARRVEMGPLLDMASALLDALDINYGLFAEAERTERAGDSAIPMNSQDSDAPLHTAGT